MNAKKSTLIRLTATLISVVACFLTVVAPALAQTPTTLLTGNLADGTSYQIRVPEGWNGTVFIDLDGSGMTAAYSQWLYDRGIARAGTSRAVTMWSIHRAVDNQAEMLSVFEQRVGPVSRAVTWGTSMGGFVSAAVAQKYPDRFDAAVPVCGGLAGYVAMWNVRLDLTFVLKTLLAPSSTLPIINIPSDIPATVAAWQSMLAAAQATPEGRARIALAAAIAQVPAWTPDGIPAASEHDLLARQLAQYNAISGPSLPLIGQSMSSRRQVEQATGGNPSWNTGVDYAELLRKANNRDRQTVTELYRVAGLDLQADLGTLAQAPRIAADPAAVEVARRTTYDGNLQIPVLTLNNTGDQISMVASQGSYEAIVRKAGQNEMLRQTYVHADRHCSQNAAELVAAFETILRRLDTGRWDSTSAPAMNARASATGLGTPRFINFNPDTLNRAFSAHDVYVPAASR